MSKNKHQIEESFAYCRDCGTKLSVDNKFCSNCGSKSSSFDELKTETNNQKIDDSVDKSIEVEKTNQKSNKLKLIIGIGLAVVIFLGVFYLSSNTLDANDKIAYDLIIKHSHKFRDPSSVQLVGGVVGSGDEGNYAFLRLSATNGYGARGSNDYYLRDTIIYEEEDCGFVCSNTSELNISKINKMIRKNFGVNY